jgi:hypothetical protein
VQRAPKAPSGPLGDVTRSVADLLSPNTTATDPRFDDFLELLNLKADYPDRADAITAQIKAGRAAVTKRAAAASSGRLASVRGVLGESIVLEFATTLANALDEFTKKSGTQ